MTTMFEKELFKNTISSFKILVFFLLKCKLEQILLNYTLSMIYLYFWKFKWKILIGLTVIWEISIEIFLERLYILRKTLILFAKQFKKKYLTLYLVKMQPNGAFRMLVKWKLLIKIILDLISYFSLKKEDIIFRKLRPRKFLW